MNIINKTKKTLSGRIISMILCICTAAVMIQAAIVPVYASASDYGMAVTQMHFYYAKDADTGKMNMYYQFKYGATGNYDITYTIKLLDSNGSQVTAWNSNTFYSGTSNSWLRYHLSDCNSRLTQQRKYTIRVTGECVAGGKTQSFYWDYSFTHDTSINDYGSQDLGMNAKKDYIEYDYGDFNARLLLSASAGSDVHYVVELLDTKNNVVKRWDKVTIPAGTTDKGYLYSTKGLALWDTGTYIYRVRGWVLFDNDVSRYFYWDLKYTLN